MPRLLFLFVVVLLTSVAHTTAQTQVTSPIHPDHIDSLNTTDDVLHFIKSLVKGNPLLQGLVPVLPLSNADPLVYPAEYRRQLDSFGLQPFEKVDLDGNGLSDLLWSGYDSLLQTRITFIVWSIEQDSFLIRILPKDDFVDFFGARCIQVQGKPMLQTLTARRRASKVVVKPPRLIKDSVYFEKRMDTLQVIATWPVEWRPHSAHRIDTLIYQFSTSGTWIGSFRLTLVQDSLRLKKERTMAAKTPVDSGVSFVSRMEGLTAPTG
jgi:hypothetical protein